MEYSIITEAEYLIFPELQKALNTGVDETPNSKDIYNFYIIPHSVRTVVCLDTGYDACL